MSRPTPYAQPVDKLCDKSVHVMVAVNKFYIKGQNEKITKITGNAESKRMHTAWPPKVPGSWVRFR